MNTEEHADPEAPMSFEDARGAIESAFAEAGLLEKPTVLSGEGALTIIAWEGNRAVVDGMKRRLANETGWAIKTIFTPNNPNP